MSSETTESIPAALDVTIQIPIDTLLGSYTERVERYYTADPDADWQEPPAIVLDAIGERVAQLLLKKFETEALKTAKSKVERAINDRITAIVTEALEGEFQPLNPYGERAGNPTTVRGMAVKMASEWFEKEVGTYDRRQKQGPALIAKMVDEAMRTDLKDALDAGRKQVLATLQAKAAEAIAETVAKMSGVTR